jgi:hypothetical protein
MWMQSKGLGSGARKLVSAFSTIRSIDITVPVKRQQHKSTLGLQQSPNPIPTWLSCSPTSAFICQKAQNF